MVTHSDARLDAVFAALSDPTRRAVLVALCDGERSVSELASPFGMSLPGFGKHLGVLEDAGLLQREKSGRVVTCRLNARAMKEAFDWLARYEVFWNAALDRLHKYLESKGEDEWQSSTKRAPRSNSGVSSTRRPQQSLRRGRSRSR